ncbi:MAG: acyl carrier protein [Oscillospiraceae bacterium]|nr:acyl carrier protein [Ruminococcus sp.]MBQ4346212.1 acyl carrier protein [Oscillospiraceae bacterium]
MVQEKLIELIAENVDCDASELNESTEFASLGIDSLDIAELLMTVEDEFGVTVEMDPALKTVGDLVAKIEEGRNA